MIRYISNLVSQNAQFIRYLIGGAYNTLFGFLFFATIYYYFSEQVHYIILAIISNIAAITNSFIVYRLFVFKSKGNILKEYLRVYVVYGLSAIISLIIMALMVELLQIHPVVTQGVILFVTVIISYFGHKNFSFKKVDS
ncbi:MAG: GtrA family protein [Magnetococcales bacterium]|nr:GtrA family protein [Magnetococcales bacterium]